MQYTDNDLIEYIDRIPIYLSIFFWFNNLRAYSVMIFEWFGNPPHRVGPKRPKNILISIKASIK